MCYTYNMNHIEERLKQRLKDKEKRKAKKKRKKYAKEYRVKQKKLVNKLKKEKLAEAREEYIKSHPEEIREQARKYRLEYYQKNKEKILNDAKKYRQKIKARNYNTEYNNKRRKTDNDFRLRNVLRTRIKDVLKGNTKSASTMDLLSCSVEFARKHLESQFTERMSWDNHGTGHKGKGMQQWHIDHIKPCASFDLSKPEEQRKCFHYSNLQPLWATHNLQKSDNI